MATRKSTSVFQHLRRLAFLRSGAGLTDGQLLESFISSREEAAFEAVVLRHGPMVMGVRGSRSLPTSKTSHRLPSASIR